MDQVVLWQIGIGVAAFAVGLGAGLVLRQPDRRMRAQLEALRSELLESQRRFDQHRARVDKHFERTSDLFRDMTEQYTALYSHLAEGARELCSEGGPALGRGLNDPLLAATLGAGEQPTLETDEGEVAAPAPDAEPQSGESGER
jgi:uncharacterized membrane-anchored protein YhcB (DUF1043 family)